MQSNSDAFVSFMQPVNGGRVNIGATEHPKKRLERFQRDSPKVLCIILLLDGGREKRDALHQRFSDHRAWGEWFNPSHELMEFIERKILEKAKGDANE